MKVKKYEAKTEQEAIEKVKDDLGKEALILNIKKINPKGIFKLFRQPTVEVLAALDGQLNKTNDFKQQESNFNNIVEETIRNISNGSKQSEKTIVDEQKETIKGLESKLDHLEGLLTKVMERVSTENQIQASYTNETCRKYNSTILQLFYDNLIKNEVMPELAETILKDLDEMDEETKNDVNNLIAIVYNRIMEIMGNPTQIEMDNKKPKIVFFVGPTGVGKTTTIAKITAHFSLNEKKKVGLITADTYRIAAVEQLKTYAEILNVPVEVIYSSDELLETLEKIKDVDIVFIDTAGRSHKNAQQFQELDNLLSLVDEKQIFLVLSATTKYKDMLNILNQYSSISDYDIIFTKADETTSLGTILNVRYLTQKSLSYITFGQDVPDDIELISPKKMTKALLGSMDE
ncbi:MAG: flagellar biosynthesis protein FlhF [Epulopiscium sp.]|nr:flagellar biosynthesis protein FlhF [Candidatus Epulonipiscium sp.]